MKRQTKPFIYEKPCSCIFPQVSSMSTELKSACSSFIFIQWRASNLLRQFKSLRGPKGQSLKLLHQWWHIYSHPVLSMSAVESGTVISALNRKPTLEQLHFSGVYLCSFLPNFQQLLLMWNECLRQNLSSQNYRSEFTSMHPSLLHKQEKRKTSRA